MLILIGIYAIIEEQNVTNLKKIIFGILSKMGGGAVDPTITPPPPHAYWAVWIILDPLAGTCSPRDYTLRTHKELS